MGNKKAKIIFNIYNILYAHYGDLNWWPASSPYEVMVGAVLTQNTAWSNVEKAITNFEDKLSYTKRLFERRRIDIKLDYHSMKAYVESEIPPDTAAYNNFHALIVINAKEHCRKKPKCNGCPLNSECEGRIIDMS